MALVLMRSRFFDAVFRCSVGLDWLGEESMTELYLGAEVFRALASEKPGTARFHVLYLAPAFSAMSSGRLRSGSATPCQLNLVGGERYAKKEFDLAIFGAATFWNRVYGRSQKAL